MAPAGLGRRLASAVYEAMLLAGVLFVAGIAMLPFGPSAPLDPRAPFPEPGMVQRIAFFVWYVGIAGTYFVWSWSRGRRTLPMKTWRMRLVTGTGAEVGPSRAAARFLATLAGPACALAAYALLSAIGHPRWAWLLAPLNFAWAAVDRDRQFLHDRLAGTRLVRGE